MRFKVRYERVIDAENEVAARKIFKAEINSDYFKPSVEWIKSLSYAQLHELENQFDCSVAYNDHGVMHLETSEITVSKIAEIEKFAHLSLVLLAADSGKVKMVFKVND